MIPELQKRFDILESKRISFLDELNQRRSEQLTFKPDPDHWSMSDIVQHLMLSENAFLLQVTEKDFKPRKARFNPLIGSLIIWLVFKFGFRVKAPVKSIVPKETMSLGESSALWNDKRRALMNYLEELDERTARKKFFFHPIQGSIHAISLIRFLTVHFDHHMKQVKRIRRSPDYPN